MSSEGEIFAYSALGFVAGLACFGFGFKSLKLKRLIENTPSSKIRSMAMGLVEVHGKAKPDKTGVMKSPFSGTNCVYYEYVIQEYRRGRKSSHWVTVKKGSTTAPFILQDDTGMAHVNPNGANIDLPVFSEHNSGTGKPPPQIVQDFLSQNKVSFTGLFGWNKTMRYREYIIPLEETIYVLGTADDNPFVAEGTETSEIKDIMICRGKNEKCFYISNKSEKTVLNSLKWKVFGQIFGGAALAVVCLAIILAQLRMF